jgi:hypothetical protein
MTGVALRAVAWASELGTGGTILSRVLSYTGVTSCAPTGSDAMTIDATNVNESADFTVDSSSPCNVKTAR